MNQTKQTATTVNAGQQTATIRQVVPTAKGGYVIRLQEMNAGRFSAGDTYHPSDSATIAFIAPGVIWVREPTALSELGLSAANLNAGQTVTLPDWLINNSN